MGIPMSKWEWFGKPGHYICAEWCRFHLTTVVGKYVVSTVGELVHPSDSGGSEATEMEWMAKNWPGADVGSNRKYETMVFLVGKRCRRKECGKCGHPELKNARELDANVYNTRGDAQRGHLEMCERWAKK